MYMAAMQTHTLLIAYKLCHLSIRHKEQYANITLACFALVT